MELPLFSGFQGRHAGILLHPTCLPSEQGIGTLGKGAFDFIDFVAECGLGWWQMCPLGPTGYGDSPYQCFSAFAGNPYLIDLDIFVRTGFLSTADLEPLRRFSRSRVEYGYLWEHYIPIMAKAWEAAKTRPELVKSLGDMARFRQENEGWLKDYALFTALKKHFEGAPWYEWPENARNHTKAAASKWPATVRDDVEAVVFQQFVFDLQWQCVREHAMRRGVRLIGDAPIFVARDSADVWGNPQFFQLDQNGQPLCVAGVPPDYFSSTGQLWGNPLYDWEALKKVGYKWWLQRLRADLKKCDAVRVDHFRGFYDYWQIPAGAADARKGKWQLGPGLDFFATVRRELGDVALIAEDLGELSPGVHTLRKATGLPGMAILQFAFGGDASNLYLPHNHSRDSVVYPGTHDNDTTCNWYKTAPEETRNQFRLYLGSSGEAPHWDFIRAAFTSPASLAVVSFQDVLGLGAEGRFNTPGTTAGNWQWRFTSETLAHAKAFLAPNLRKLAGVTGRIPAPPTQSPGKKIK
ncbi:MAG: 4-alpha-glucanotransferase [Puniceicoccales bacterium]|jgi:4-alpha-glucanotransferase|nr:4-alpha-glucanotransferase [Puniceicoccales bacterium]